MSYLVLSRKESEAILIGADIKIMVVGIYRGQVRLGIQVPESVKILRDELAEREVKQG